MYYYKRLDENKKIWHLLTCNIHPNSADPFLIEITKEEYESIRAEIETENQSDELDPDDITDSEALNAILEGDT